jgi:hypothetical protein
MAYFITFTSKKICNKNSVVLILARPTSHRELRDVIYLG